MWNLSYKERKTNKQKNQNTNRNRKKFWKREATPSTQKLFIFFNLFTISFSLPLQLNTLTLLIKEYVEID